MTRNCEHCGKICTPRQPNRYKTSFCSRECHVAYRSVVPPKGTRFGRWVVQGVSERRRKGNLYLLCKCDCGTERFVGMSQLKNGGSKSCNCIKKEVVHGKITHGMSGTPEFKTFHSAKKRCTNPKVRSFPRYGGRGIEFRFESFEQFYKELGPKPTPTHSINRIDNDGHYEPGNVEWATDEEQRKNKRRNGPMPKVRPP